LLARKGQPAPAERPQKATSRHEQEPWEQEVSDYLGRVRYQRREPGKEHQGYRNGYEAARLPTAEGRITVQAPHVQDGPGTYRSKLMGFLRGNSELSEPSPVEMYARGASTRDMTHRSATGKENRTRSVS